MSTETTHIEALADLVERRASEHAKIVRAFRETGHNPVSAEVGHVYQDVADALTKAGMTIVRCYAGEVDVEDYPADGFGAGLVDGSDFIDCLPGWLRDHDAALTAKAKAEAWDEAVESAHLHETEHHIGIRHATNPYRAAREAS